MATTPRWLSTFLCTSLLLACGDDTGPGGSSDGGNGGQSAGGDNPGGAPQGGNGGAPQGGGQVGGNGGDGAQSQGGNGGAGGSVQGGGGAGGGTGQPGVDGAPCTADSECDGGLCLNEADFGFPGGMCTELCSGACTDANSSCVELAEDVFLCLRDCDPMVGCGLPSVLNCFDAPTAPLGGICLGVCDMNGDCTVGGNECQFAPEGYCAPPEVCDNAMDDDFDGDTDCNDVDCAADPTCAAACSSPTVAMATNNGDTTSGTTTLDGSCNDVGAGEEIFSYTAAVTGVLDLTVQSATDHVIYVRTDCSDAQSELGCVDAVIGGADETASLVIQAGEQIFIVVDAFEPGEEGPFTLLVDFTPAPAAELDCTDFGDSDFDGSIDCADSPDCNGTPACTPGATALNGPCTAHTDCASVAGNDPACVTPAVGVNANMCSEWCNLTTNDCGANRTCLDVGVDEGLCFANCTGPADCPAEFVCATVGTVDICLPDVPAGWTCDPSFFNDSFCDCGCGVFDVDCADATVGSCEFCDDMGSCSATACPGTIDPLDNSTCQ